MSKGNIHFSRTLWSETISNPRWFPRFPECTQLETLFPGTFQRFYEIHSLFLCDLLSFITQNRIAIEEKDGSPNLERASDSASES